MSTTHGNFVCTVCGNKQTTAPACVVCCNTKLVRLL
jgi:hypothetical protein